MSPRPRPARAIAALAIVLLAGAAGAPAATSAAPQGAPGASQAAPGARLEEVIVTVSDLARLEAVFREVLRWEVVFRGALRDDEAAGWGLPAGVRGQQVLMGSPSAGHGRIRLVELRLPRAGPMRPAPHWWDTGGAFAINLFASDAEALLDGLRARGWSTALPMQSYEEVAGGRVAARGRFARMVGPDDLVLSFQERQVPALDKWPAFRGASPVENVMEPVVALEDWTRVAATLLGVAPPPPTTRDVSGRPGGAAAYGLPASLGPASRATQSILRIGPAQEQMLTAWQFESLRGADYSGQIDAYHLGVLALRVRVPDAGEAARRLQRDSIDAAAACARRRVRPHGEVDSVAVRAGGGSRLLVEAFSAAGTGTGCPR